MLREFGRAIEVLICGACLALCVRHDIQSIGIDKLRNVYAAAGLSIKPKTQASKIDAIKKIIRAWE